MKQTRGGLSTTKLLVPTAEKRVTGWSYSAWGMFKSCMSKYYHVRVLGMKETESNIHMERGIKLHKIAEQYLKGAVSKLPPEFSSLRAEYAALKRASPIVEQFWGVDSKWGPTNYGSWAVMKMDAAVAPSRVTDNRLFIQDLKTGREYPDHFGQGELYGCIGMSLFPKADGVEAEFWYADQGYSMSHRFDRDQIKRARKLWTERGNEMLSPRKKWPTSPSESACRFCFLSAEKGGPCKDYHGG